VRRRHWPRLYGPARWPAPSARRARTSLRLRRARRAATGSPGAPGSSCRRGHAALVGGGRLRLDWRRVPVAPRWALRPQADDRVLDIGCGIGPARARRWPATCRSTGRTRASTSAPTRSAWCTQRYGHYPNFRFVHADVRNGRYNPAGTTEAVAYEFPSDDGAFDVVGPLSVPHPPDRRRARCTTSAGAAGARPRRADCSRRCSCSTRRGAASRARHSARWRTAWPSWIPRCPRRRWRYESDWLLEALRAAGLDLVALHPACGRGGRTG
jgi:SAM-dependent methyltransferase